MTEEISSKQNKPEAYTDNITYFYLQARNSSTPDEEVLQRDLTYDFWVSLRERIKRGRLITISVRGETALGKSTCSLVIKKFINDCLRKFGKRSSEENINEIEYETICSDQIEANRFFLKDYKNVCVLIDEYSALSQSDFNATTEQNLFLFHTDTMAQKFIHKVFCTPRAHSMYDAGATYLLDIIAIDKEKGSTFCRLYYNDPTSGSIGGLALGSITIKVNDLIKNWREIESTFRKQHRTKEEEKKIERLAEKDYYIRYMIKKFRRLSLLEKHGVKDIRQLERAVIILECYKRLEYLADGRGAGVTRDVISGQTPTVIANVLREMKLLHSSIGRADIEQEINSILYGLNTISKMECGLDKRLHGKKTMLEKDEKKCIEITQVMKKAHKKRLEDLEKDVQILNEYYNIK